MEPQKNIFTFIASGDIEKVKELIQNDPELINAVDEIGVSAVLYSYYVQEPDIANFLIEKGANVGIFEASACGRLERLKELLERDPGLVNEFSPDGFQPLGYACFFGHADTASYLINSGASINSVSQNGLRVTPLHSAVANQNLEITRMLIKNGAGINAVQNGGYTPLHSAAFNGQIEMVELLLDAGAEPKTRNEENKTPEDLARENGHKSVVEFLERLEN